MLQNSIKALKIIGLPASIYIALFLHDFHNICHLQNDVKTSVSPPITKFTSSNRKLPSEPDVRPGSWNSSHSAKTTTPANLSATAK